MSIVERVDASVDFTFPQKNGTCTVKQMEEYLFNARMRGADDGTLVKFTVQEGYPYNNQSYTKGISVAVPATMGGYPVVTPKVVDTHKKAVRIATASGIVFGLVVLGLIALLIGVVT